MKIILAVGFLLAQLVCYGAWTWSAIKGFLVALA